MTERPPLHDGLNEAERFLGESLEVLAPLTGGEDARVHRVRSATGDWALRVSYEDRGPEELEWVSRWIEHVSEAVPEAVPRVRRGGHSFFRTAAGGAATVLPFVEGARPRRGDPGILVQAAGLLARIHRSGLTWDSERRPDGLLGARTAPVPESLRDPALDEAWAQLRAGGLTTGPVHGDYYAGNLLGRDGRVVAILDWDDACVRPLLLETAGALFEFARDPDHRIVPDRARRFLATYLNSGGPLPDAEVASLGLAMRVWVRRDAQVSLAYDPSGSRYLELQARAFRELEDRPDWIEADL